MSDNDHVAYLLNSGVSLDEIQHYIDARVPLEEVVASVKALVDAGKPLTDHDPDAQQSPAEAAPTLTTVSAVELQQKNLPPIRWIVQDLIPAGLTILASPPKFGKSWMAMHICLAVAMGGSFLGYRCHKSGTLYLALEDGEHRLKSRMQRILYPAPAPQGFDFSITAPTLGSGLIDALEAYIKQHPETGLVVLDTLQKVRDAGGGKDVYGRDYADVGALKKFADTHNIAVALIHHLRKAGDDTDPFARISGTNGISGAADTMMVLAKEKRIDDTAVLSVTGRDVEMQELVLTFNKDTCQWQNLGDADAFAAEQARQEYQDSAVVRTVKQLLEQHPAGWTGTAQQLLDAGRSVAKTMLADSPRALSSKLKNMCNLFFKYDNIIYDHKPNGTGGGKHRFYYADSPQFSELEQVEIDPLSVQSLL